MKAFKFPQNFRRGKKFSRTGFTIVEVAAMALLLIVVALLGADMGILIFASETCDKACKDCARAAGTARTPGQAIDAVNTALAFHMSQLNPIIMSNLTAQLMVYEDYNIGTPYTTSNTNGVANGPWETTTNNGTIPNSGTANSTGTTGVPPCTTPVQLYLSNSYIRSGYSPGPYVVVRTTMKATVPAPIFFFGSSITPNQIQVASVCSAPLINTYATTVASTSDLKGTNPNQANSTDSTATNANSTNSTVNTSTNASVTNPTNTSTSAANTSSTNDTATNAASTSTNSTGTTASDPNNTSTNSTVNDTNTSTNNSSTTANSASTVSNSDSTASTATDPGNTSTNSTVSDANTTATASASNTSTNSSTDSASSSNSESSTNSTSSNSTANDPTNTASNSTTNNAATSANTVATAANTAATAANAAATNAATSANSTNTAANSNSGVPDNVMGGDNSDGGHS